MPEYSEIANAHDPMPHLVSPAVIAEAQQAHVERRVTSLHDATPGEPMPQTVGIAPRALFEELRANHKLAEQAFWPQTQASMPEVVSAHRPDLPSSAETQPEPAPQPAAATGPAQASELLEKHLIFSLGAVRYAVPLDHIIEIAELENFTPVPNLPDWVMGITNLRGDIISLIDLNVLIGESSEEAHRGSNLLVAQTNVGDLTTCLVVDRVYGVVNVNPNQIQKLDKVANTVVSSHTRGYFTEGAEFLSLLDLEGLLRALELPH